MRPSFGSIKPPPRFRVPVKGSDPLADPPVSVDTELQSLDVPAGQEAAAFAYSKVLEFVPHNQRKLFPLDKKDPEPHDFPQGPFSGPIVLTEQSLIEICNIVKMQTEDPPLPFEEFVYMRKSAPGCFMAYLAALQAIQSGEDLEGNPLGGPGLAQSEQQPPDNSTAIPT